MLYERLAAVGGPYDEGADIALSQLSRSDAYISKKPIVQSRLFGSTEPSASGPIFDVNDLWPPGTGICMWREPIARPGYGCDNIGLGGFEQVIEIIEALASIQPALAVPKSE
jgi:hypothetical protein